MPATLFVVATPIGNLEDITLRALSTLKRVSLIAAEDTRRTGTLLRHFGVSTPTTSFHAHNERRKLPLLLEKLAAGEDVALVSDAGTPVIADPGQRLVAAAVEAGIAVVPVPGASAVMAALAASGLPLDSFVFLGFAPSRSNDRERWFDALAAERRTSVFFEAPHRIKNTLAKLGDLSAVRPIIVCRELTKIHEEVVRISTRDAGAMPITERGEFTLILGRLQDDAVAQAGASESEVYLFFCHLTDDRGFGRRPALAETAHKFGLSTKEVYVLIERLKQMPSP
jgi:16S rRNA (cytidine1402-2'-O)-methyltransferase